MTFEWCRRETIPVVFFVLFCNIFVHFVLTGFSNPYVWKWTDWAIAYSPLGAVFLSVACLLVESKIIGYKNSSLSLLIERHPSAKVDLFYLLLYASNARVLLGIMFTFGLLFFFNSFGRGFFSYGLLSSSSIFLQTFIYFSLMPLLFYFHHRIMHTKLFWPIHKVHHSATEMAMITNFRNHPLDLALSAFFYWTIGWVLGINFFVVLLYQIINGVYQLTAHSRATWGLYNTRWKWVQDWLILSPEEHRIHHSANPAHWNHNFGIIPAIDKFFGTWMKYDRSIEPLCFGIPDFSSQEALSSPRSLWTIYSEFLKASLRLRRNTKH